MSNGDPQYELSKAFFDSVGDKVATGPARTFNSIWRLSTGWIDMLDEKLHLIQQQSIERFKEELKEKISEIPKEHQQDPKLSLIGPALESTKYYVEEEELRNLFVSLIAKSMDGRFNNKVHHSFVEIIKQMSPTDADIFKRIGISKNIVSAKIVKLYENGSQSDVTDHFIQLYNYDRELIQLTINNLERLGLIDLDTLTPAHPDSLYDSFYEDSYFKDIELESEVSPFNKFTPDIVKSRVSITSLGKAMFEVCVV